ncbi:MAG: TPM domain-containing protein [Bdellovibrionaceae bacterium]|nr:TPM domain-containing protein [Pseudobdellovibrionaceae bacterium]
MVLVRNVSFFISLFLATTVFAVTLPSLNSPVVDEVGWLSRSEKMEIENWLYSYRQVGKAQIQVAIVQDLQGLTIEQYSIELADKWKLGNQKRDDGILFLVSANDRKMRIEVGQGLEGALTDIQTKRILDDRVRPLFKSSEFAAGIAAAIAEIIRAIDPEYAQNHLQSAAPDRVSQEKEGESYLFWIILFLFILINMLGRRRRSGFLPFIGGFGTGYSVGRGGWGSGGGGWSGGGGGFSGGGASSDW